MTQLRLFILTAMALVAAVPVNRLGAVESATPFHLRRWTTEDGLPISTVRKLLQTRDGYLWIGTKQGLARFDRDQFKVFTKELIIDDQGELSCEDLIEDAVGRLWIRLPSGLVSYYRGDFQRFSIRSGPLAGVIQTVIARRKGGLWVGTQRDGLKWFEGGVYRRAYKTEEGLASSLIGLLREDHEGRLWIACLQSSTRQLSWQRLDPEKGEWKSLSEIVGQTILDVGDVHPDAAGRLWFSTPEELFCWDNGKLDRFSGGELWKKSGTTGGLIDAEDRTLWFAPPYAKRLVRFQNGKFEQFGVEDGLADTDIRSILWDREGNLWLGFGIGGLQRLRPRGLVSIFVSDKFGNRRQVDSVASGPSGAVWMGAWDSLLRFRDGSVSFFTNAVLSQGRLVENAGPVLEDHQGRVWFGSGAGGLYTLQQDQVTRVLVDDGASANWVARSLFEDRAGRLWIGTDQGLIKKEGDRFTRFTTKDGLLDNNIMGTLDAPDGSLWVGTSRGGIHHFQNGNFRPYTVREGLLGDLAGPLCIEEDGTVWVGTQHGLNRIHGETIGAVTERQGLHDNAIFTMLDDGAGHYWAGSVHGIFRVRKADLQAVATGRLDRLFCVRYGEADGAVSVESDGGFQPGACRAADGRMWFATTRGVVVLEPDKLIARELPPLVVIEAALADEKIIFAEGCVVECKSDGNGTECEVRLPAGRGQVMELRYAANSFVAPEKVRFHYRLEPVDSTWREAGTRRVAFYNNLRPGSYRFLVEASNQEGTWSVNDATFAFSIAPKFTQTIWFPLSCGVSLLAISGSLTAWRLRWQRSVLLAQQSTAVERERTRIARDLHDDLGASLTGIALELEAAQRRGRAEGEQLNTLATEARTMALNVRELAWTSNPRCDNVGSLAAFLGELAERFCNAAGLECKLELPVADDLREVPARVRHELLMVVKESLANIAKHAGAHSVILQLTVIDGELCLTVRDDGRGFDPARVNGGSGLRNLRERLEQIGGSFGATSSPTDGTTIIARLPLRG